MPPKRKPGRPKKVHPGGRPTVMTKEALAKLEEAFKMDCTDTEACFSANISVDALYDYQKLNPEFTKRKKALKESPAFKARKTVVGELSSDVCTAKWYLERKKKDEFGPKHELDLTGKIIIKAGEVKKPDNAGI